MSGIELRWITVLWSNPLLKLVSLLFQCFKIFSWSLQFFFTSTNPLYGWDIWWHICYLVPWTTKTWWVPNTYISVVAGSSWWRLRRTASYFSLTFQLEDNNKDLVPRYTENPLIQTFTTISYPTTIQGLSQLIGWEPEIDDVKAELNTYNTSLNQTITHQT